MNQRLVWNFEFSPKVALALETLVDKKDDHLKWEIRYFWSDDKPIILGFGPKIILNCFEEAPQPNEPIPPSLHKTIQQIEKNGVGILVKKEALLYKFPTKPKIKMELARLEVLDKIYFSVCVEGKSVYLVETISKYLLGEHVSCDYVTFLKNILKL
ncbi:MAG: hypothetical protein HYX60_01320 [Legionella longbeachae]|nr:hypothetical protein [Legionella longbeachae]